MGTSRRWPGPSGGSWTQVNGRLTQSLNELQKHPGSIRLLAARPGSGTGPEGIGDAGQVLAAGLSPEQVVHLGQGYRVALATELSADPECFGLRDAMRHSGRRLVDTMEIIDQHGVRWLGPFEGRTAEDRHGEFVAGFTDHVADRIGLTVDAVVRHAATRAARQLLDHGPELRHAVETGHGDATGIGGDLFCQVYRCFFAQAVTGFVQSVITAKIALMVPAADLSVDPAECIAGWVAAKITATVPTPCRQVSSSSGSSLAAVGRELLDEAVGQALGLAAGGSP